MKKPTIIKQFGTLPLTLRVAIILSLLCFAVSLTQPVYNDAMYSTLSYGDSGLGILIMGWASLVGGLAPFAIWLANPIYFISIYLIIKCRWYSILFIGIATVLSSSFYFFGSEIIVGRQPAIPNFLESGYYLWLASFLILFAGYFLAKIEH